MIRQDWHPLTNAQQAYWDEFIQYPDIPLSIVAHCLEITGAVDVQALSKAIDQTLKEAEVLWLKFRCLDEHSSPEQAVHFDEDSCVDVVDLRTQEGALQHVHSSMHADAGCAIDLTSSRITKSRLYVVRPDRVFWYLRTHHIAVDGYSMSLIEQRCAALYGSFLQGDAPAPSFKPFETYIHESRNYAQSTRFDLDQSYWQSYLESASLNLSHMSIPATKTWSVEEAIPDAFGDALVAMSKKLLIGWSDILTLLTSAYLAQFWCREERGSESLPVWIPFMNRMGNPCANTPSLMVNTIPYIAKLDPDEAIEPFLIRSVKELRTHYRHGRYRVENKLSSGGEYFLSPFVNILPFESVDFLACTTTSTVLAGGVADGFNVTFRSSKLATNMSLKIEAECRLFNQSELKHHATSLQKYLQNILAPE